jgi:hypothetical protein
MSTQSYTRSIHPSAYVPTQPRSGGVSGNTIYRLENMIIQGEGDLTYAQAYAGTLSLSETIATSDLTGTIAVTSGSTTVTGTGTAFTTELNPGQYVIAVNATTHESYLLVVRKIVSDTSYIAWKAPTSSKAGMTGKRMPVLFAVDQDRGTQIWGNTVRLDRGTLLSVGDGTFRANAQALNASLTVTRAPKISLYNSGAGTYTNFTLGMTLSSVTITAASNANPVSLTSNSHGLSTGDGITISGGTGNWTAINGSWTVTVTGVNTFTIPVDSTAFGALTGTPVYPARPTLVAASGGTRNMQAGVYSVVIAPARTQTLGYNNPSQRATVTLTANQRIQITFPAMDTTNGQNAWNVYVTRFADTLGSDLNYLEGPWYFFDQYTGSTSGFSTYIEWYDAEVERNGLITFDNDPPPSASFVAMLNNVPVWISCQGTNGSSPGPFIFPAKPGNIEAAPAVIAFSSSPPETILGVVSAAGRAYLLTTNHLEIFQGTPQADVPILIRPFWTVGFTGPDQVVFVNDTLYGHSVQGPARSAPDGVPGSQEFDFAVKVSEVTDSWIAGHVKVSYDPVTNGVPYIHAADSLNSSGFWTTRLLLFGLRQQEWIGNILLSSTTQDMIVCGAAMVGNALQLLVGGRLANDTVSVGTYTFNLPAGTSVSYYLAPPFTDYDSELRDHVLKRARVTGKVTGASVGIFGAGATESIPVTALEAGNSSSTTGAISLTNTSTVTQSAQIQVNVPNVSQSTIRVQGVYNGTDAVLDRIDEIVVEAASQGVRR